MPSTFRSIEIGKPLDTSILPTSAIVNEVTQSDDPYLQVLEYHQCYLPVGLRRYEIRVYRDRQNNVVRLRYEEYAVSYWLLLLSGSEVRRERFIDDAGQPQEKLIKNKPLEIMVPLPNFHVFMMGVGQCFHEARTGQAQANVQRHQVTTEPASAQDTSARN